MLFNNNNLYQQLNDVLTAWRHNEMNDVCPFFEYGTLTIPQLMPRFIYTQISDNNERRAILTDTGQLRRSIHSRVTDNAITFYSDLPYAEIHNEGGEVIVTAKMKKFFWHKYYHLMMKLRGSTTIGQ